MKPLSREFAFKPFDDPATAAMARVALTATWRSRTAGSCHWRNARTTPAGGETPVEVARH